MQEAGDVSARIRPRTQDERGRLVTVLDPLRLYALHRHDLIEKEALARIAESIQPGAPRALRLFLPLALVIMLLAPLGIAVDVAIEGRAAWNDLVGTLTNPVFVAALGPSLVAGVVVPLFIDRRRRLRHARAALLLHKRCPHCGYDMQSLPVDPQDGATVCPECACAWRLDEPHGAELDDALLSPGLFSAAPPWARVLVFVGLLLMLLAGSLVLLLSG